ncbi:MAG: CopG family transcriptional regulator [Actinomycetota bacterium]|nr:CopG family transcriptional regulator [Actinomycetota bacterium]
MTSQILVRVDKDLKDKFRKLSGIEQKSVNEKMRELMEEYVREHSIEPAINALWDEIGGAMRKKGYKESDVEKMIKKVRSGK